MRDRSQVFAELRSKDLDLAKHTAVPVSEPGATGIVRQQRSGARQLQKLLAGGVPIIQRRAQQKDLFGGNKEPCRRDKVRHGPYMWQGKTQHPQLLRTVSISRHVIAEIVASGVD